MPAWRPADRPSRSKSNLSRCLRFGHSPRRRFLHGVHVGFCWTYSRRESISRIDLGPWFSVALTHWGGERCSGPRLLRICRPTAAAHWAAAHWVTGLGPVKPDGCRQARRVPLGECLSAGVQRHSVVGDGHWIWTEPPADGVGYLEPRSYSLKIGIELAGDR